MHILWFFVCAYVPSILAYVPIILEKFFMVICGNNFVQNRVKNPSILCKRGHSTTNTCTHKNLGTDLLTHCVWLHICPSNQIKVTRALH